jgi:hypothetical protein
MGVGGGKVPTKLVGKVGGGVKVRTEPPAVVVTAG